MNQPQSTSPGKSFTRLLVLFLVGLAVGAALTVIGITALNRGTAWDHAVMAMMGAQMKVLSENGTLSSQNHPMTIDYCSSRTWPS